MPLRRSTPLAWGSSPPGSRPARPTRSRRRWAAPTFGAVPCPASDPWEAARRGGGAGMASPCTVGAALSALLLYFRPGVAAALAVVLACSAFSSRSVLVRGVGTSARSLLAVAFAIAAGGGRGRAEHKRWSTPQGRHRLARVAAKPPPFFLLGFSSIRVPQHPSEGGSGYKGAEGLASSRLIPLRMRMHAY